MRGPESHVLGIFEREVNSDVLPTEESASTLLLLIDPIFERLNDHLFEEWLHFLRRLPNSVNDSIFVASDIAAEVAFEVLPREILLLDFDHLVAVFIVPETVVPPWVLAAFFVPIAVIVLGVVSSTYFSRRLIASDPVLEIIDILVLVCRIALAIVVAGEPSRVFTAGSLLIAFDVVAS